MNKNNITSTLTTKIKRYIIKCWNLLIDMLFFGTKIREQN